MPRENYNSGNEMYSTLINVSADQTISSIKVIFKRHVSGIHYGNWTGQLWISKH